MPSLLTLNVSNPPRERAETLLHWLWARPEQLWVLTEVGRGEGSGLLLSVCRAAGFALQVPDRSQLGVAVVARAGSLEEEPLAPAGVLPGRVAPVLWRPASGAEPLRVLATYGAASDPVRYSSRVQRERKRQWLTAYDVVVSEWVGRGPRGVVLGDLNLVDPVHEAPLRHVLPEETAFYRALGSRHGLVDAFRHCHPEEDAVSWLDHSGVGCRYDHAFVTPDLAVLGCDLDAQPRLDGLTDHSALTVTVAGPRDAHQR